MDNVIAFDSAGLNGDRKSTNPNLLWDGAEKVHVIDHGLACPVYLWPPASRVPSPLFPDDQIQKHSAHDFLSGRGCTYEQLVTRWRNTVTPEFLAAVRATIPQQWERQSGDLDAIFTLLQDRHARLLEITTQLRRLLK
jgi:hypothetical protein